MFGWLRVDGRTGLRRHRSTKPPVAIERGRENFDRDNAPEQTVVSVVHVRPSSRG
jgi:hypothetical protein